MTSERLPGGTPITGCGAGFIVLSLLISSPLINGLRGLSQTLVIGWVPRPSNSSPKTNGVNWPHSHGTQPAIPALPQPCGPRRASINRCGIYLLFLSFSPSTLKKGQRRCTLEMAGIVLPSTFLVGYLVTAQQGSPNSIAGSTSILPPHGRRHKYF